MERERERERERNVNRFQFWKIYLSLKPLIYKVNNNYFLFLTRSNHKDSYEKSISFPIYRLILLLQHFKNKIVYNSKYFCIFITIYKAFTIEAKVEMEEKIENSPKIYTSKRTVWRQWHDEVEEGKKGMIFEQWCSWLQWYQIKEWERDNRKAWKYY